ncbi:H-2 class II histocompatibility antigen, E-S beta chain-like [Scomber japonicus]|uniref:H-2 class II histocompatibility antigen, E-S beta chain-like n=1 Tax=Scomber japonicus TaxID=13676 RepID=UPI002305E578|nr:H-2 class II histocompatibility antigen, E-S beta chain-like [Scomber japonicus]
MASSFLSFSLLFITVYTADGFMHYDAAHCQFNSTELKDIRFIRSWYYNRLAYTRFDSSVGKFVGFTEYGVMNAEYWNNDTSILAQMNVARETYCQHNIGIWYNNVLTKSVKPYVRLHSETLSAGNHPSMLVCSVYSFYPKQIIVKWLRDGQEVTSDVTSTDEMANADWYYQIHSHLEYTPRSGEKISCKVEHASLSEPLYTDWDPPLPESQTNNIAIGASGLTLGLIFPLAGFIYYKRKSRGQIPIPSRFLS